MMGWPVMPSGRLRHGRGREHQGSDENDDVLEMCGWMSFGGNACCASQPTPCASRRLLLHRELRNSLVVGGTHDELKVKVDTVGAEGVGELDGDGAYAEKVDGHDDDHERRRGPRSLRKCGVDHRLMYG